MKKRLLLLSFVEGAAVMAAELCGAKLIAPFFGSSLYIWASVMGFTLAALALGYFAGGAWSLRENAGSVLRNVLLFAGAYLLLMPAIATWLFPVLGKAAFVPGVLISCILLLVPPVLLLGAASPLFVHLQAGVKTTAGRASGSVFAMSTLGGIVSTFMCAFWLIPSFGLRISLISHGALLIALTLLILRGRYGLLFFMLPVFVLALWPAQAGSVVYRAEGIEGNIIVYDLVEDGAKRRRLVVNNIIQSEIDLATGRSTLGYIKLLDSAVQEGHGKTALFLGTGGGSAASMLRGKGFECTAVELDRRISDCAVNYFFLSPEVRLVCDDARHYIERINEKFDVIVFDVFRAEEQPAHVITVESLRSLRSRMKEDAVVIVNWHGYVQGTKGKGSEVLENTLADAGFSFRKVFTGPQEDYRNALYFAQPGQSLPAKGGELNTDDRPLFEKYNAKANLAWRRNYLRYYQGNLAGERK